MRYQKSELFQFHKGSINTLLTICLLKCVGMFQFHKGSINTG